MQASRPCAWGVAVLVVSCSALCLWGWAGCSGGGTEATTSITGTVVNAGNPDEPIENAYAYVPIGARGLGAATRQAGQPEAYAYTDAEGRFTLTGVALGDRTLVVEPPTGSGFDSLEVDLTVGGDETPDVWATVVESDVASRIASVVVTPASATVGLNGTLQCSARVTDADGQPLQLAPTWTVLGGIGSVDASGMLTAGASAATGTVTATVGAVSGQCSVTVTNDTTGGLSFSVDFPDAGAKLTTATQCVVATVLREYDAVELGTVTLTSGAPSHEVTGLAGGTRCVVRAQAYPNADATGVVQAAASTAVTVPWGDTADVDLTLASTVASVAVSPAQPQLPVGQTSQLTATALNGEGSVVLVSDSWQWTTSAATVAGVSTAGLVTAVSEGAATVTATETDSGVSGSTVVTVGSPDLTVNPPSVSLGKRDAWAPLTITTDPLTVWTITHAIPWLTVTPQTDAGTRDVDLEIDRTGLANGDYSGTLTVAAGALSIAVPVDMSVGPVLLVNPTDLSFVTGVDSLTTEIKNEGSGTFEWSTTHTLGWLRIEPPSGTADTLVTVSASRAGLSPGIHQGAFMVVSNDVDIEVQVAVEVP